MSFLSQPVQDVLIKPKRMIGSIAVQTVIDEHTTDTLTITKQPVQQGASITDHAYMEPTTFSANIYFKDNVKIFSPSTFSQLYKQLLDLQMSRVPFDIVTPKRVYNSMLMATISQTTDKNTENCLAINFSFQQILIVSVSTVSVPRSKQRNAGATGATQNAGNKSALVSLKEGLAAVFSKAAP